jgi:hypothetical protein
MPSATRSILRFPLLATQATATGTIRAIAKSQLTGKLNTLEIPMSEADFDASLSAWVNGALIQTAFPTLDAGLREFIKTGITPDEWDRVFGE